MGSGVGLDERGKDLGMLPKVGQEGVAAPPSHDFHCLYGQAEE